MVGRSMGEEMGLWEWGTESEWPGGGFDRSSRGDKHGHSGGHRVHSSPENLRSVGQMPSPGLWDSHHEEGQECGWQGLLMEEKGAVSKSLCSELPSKKGRGYSPCCTSSFTVLCLTTGEREL